MEADSQRRPRNVPGLVLAAIVFGALFTIAWTFLLMMVYMQDWWDPEAFVLIGVIAGSVVGLRESRAALRAEFKARRDESTGLRSANVQD